MRYHRAQDILPEELLEQIQAYIDGESIYIPRKAENKKSWGETTDSRQEVARRNMEIYATYTSGVSVETLTRQYYLSEKSIRRIILEYKRKA